MNITAGVKEFLLLLERQNMAKATLRTRTEALNRFLNYCNSNKLFSIVDISSSDLRQYIATVFISIKKDGSDLSDSRKRTLLISLKLFYRFLLDENVIIHNPIENIKLPSINNKLPASFLSQEEINRIIKKIRVRDFLGTRNRAIVELLYSTGIRRNELTNLKVYDIDFQKEILWVRKGKGSKDRVVPVGCDAIKYLNKYITGDRQKILKGSKNIKSFEHLFLSRKKNPLSSIMINQMILGYKKKAKINTKGSCHLFRHSMATHMLANGADIRYIQEMLGHSNISTTEIYTKVEISNLEKEYARVI